MPSRAQASVADCVVPWRLMRRGPLALASILGFVGCVTVTATPVKAPDGQPATLIECHQKESQCVTEAQRVCPGATGCSMPKLAHPRITPALALALSVG